MHALRVWLVAAAITVVLPSAIATATDNPVGTPISPAAASSAFAHRLEPLAGDAQQLIYALVPVSGNGTSLPGEAVLESADANGHSTEIGPGPIESSGKAQHYSLTDDMLTTGSDPYGSRRLDWWDLASQTSGSLIIPGAWAGSSDDGWIYSHGRGLYDETTAGVSTLVANPFTNAKEAVVYATVGPTGIVAAGSKGSLALVTFAGAVTALDSDWSTYSSQPNTFITCDGTSAAYTLCETNKTAGGPGHGGAFTVASQRVPLDGSGATTVSDVCTGGNTRFPSVAFTSSTMVCADDTVLSQPLTPDNAPTQSSSYVAGTGFGDGALRIVAAFGKPVIANSSRTYFAVVNDVTTRPKFLLSGPPSDITVGGFDLTAGRVVWNSDPPGPGGATSESVVAQSMPVTAADGSLATGTTTMLGSGVGWPYIAASGATTSIAVSRTVDGVKVWTLRVTSPYRTTKIRSVSPGSLSISGAHAIYRTAATSRRPYGRYLLLNTVTGKTAPIPALAAAQSHNLRLSPTAIWGNYVGYVDGGGVVRRLNVVTGKVQKVGRHAAPYSPGQVQLYGPYVGWLAQKSPSAPPRGYFRNLSTNSHRVALPKAAFLVALTNNGIVTSLGAHPTETGSHAPTAYKLRGYGKHAKSTRILYTPDSQSRAQVDSSVIAWLDHSDVLRAAALPGHVLAPLRLGTPYAPSVFNRHHKAWHPTVAFSTPLASCQFAFKRGKHVVATVPCNSTLLSNGDASVQWHGTKTSGKRAPTGTYKWIAKVRGTGGQQAVSRGSVEVK